MGSWKHRLCEKMILLIGSQWLLSLTRQGWKELDCSLFASTSYYLYSYSSVKNAEGPFLPFCPSTQEPKHDCEDVSKLRCVTVVAPWMCLPRGFLQHATATFVCPLSPFCQMFVIFLLLLWLFFSHPVLQSLKKPPCHPREASDSGARHCWSRAYPRYAGAPMYCSEEPDYFLFHAAFSIHSAVPRVGEQRKWYIGSALKAAGRRGKK